MLPEPGEIKPRCWHLPDKALVWERGMLERKASPGAPLASKRQVCPQRYASHGVFHSCLHPRLTSGIKGRKREDLSEVSGEPHGGAELHL